MRVFVFLISALLSAVLRMERCGGGALFVRAREVGGSTNTDIAPVGLPPSSLPTISTSSSSSSLAFTRIGVGVGEDAANALLLSTNNDASPDLSAAIEWRRRARAKPRGSISGYAFFDFDGDGARDDKENGIASVSAFLFNCANDIVRYTTTDAEGYYSFEGISDGEYYIAIPKTPMGYEFSDRWIGLPFGSYLYESAIDPASGRTDCFNVVEGADMTLSFGLKLVGSFVTSPHTTIAAPSPPAPWLPAIAVSSASSSAFTRIGGGVDDTMSSANDPLTDRAQGTSSISGHGFFDSHIDGTYDLTAGTLDFGKAGIAVNLFSCTDEMINTTVTDSLGYYSFEDLPVGRYYIMVPSLSLPQYHELSQIWNGKTDEASALLHPDVDSAVNPDTGRSKCFDLKEGGGDEDVSFGLQLDIPSIDGLPATTLPPSPAPSNAPPFVFAPSKTPTPAPLREPLITFSPSERPTTEVTLPPSKAPSGSPSKPSEMLPPPPTEAPINAPTPAPLKAAVASSNSVPNLTSWPISVGLAQTSPPTRENPELLPKSPVTLTPALFESTSEPPNRPIAAIPPSQLPSAPPSRSGDLHGPTTTVGLEMTIRGIEQLEDEEAWSLATGNYIMSYFNLTNEDPAVSDVTASIRVTNQTTYNDNLFQHVRVTYDQTSSHRTVDIETYDDEYVATKPFSTQQDLKEYFNALRTVSPYYEGALHAELEGDDTSGFEKLKNTPSDVIVNEESDSTRTNVLFGVFAMGAVALAILLARTRKKRPDEELLEPANNRPSSSRQQIDDDDLEIGTPLSEMHAIGSMKTIVESSPAFVGAPGKDRMENNLDDGLSSPTDPKKSSIVMPSLSSAVDRDPSRRLNKRRESSIRFDAMLSEVGEYGSSRQFPVFVAPEGCSKLSVEVGAGASLYDDVMSHPNVPASDRGIIFDADRKDNVQSTSNEHIIRVDPSADDPLIMELNFAEESLGDSSSAGTSFDWSSDDGDGAVKSSPESVNLESTRAILEADEKVTHHANVPASSHGVIADVDREDNAKFDNNHHLSKVNPRTGNLLELAFAQEDLNDSSSASSSDAGDKAEKSSPEGVDRMLELENVSSSKVILEADKKATRYANAPISDNDKVVDTGGQNITKIINNDHGINAKTAISRFVSALTSALDDLDNVSSSSGSNAGDKAAKSLLESADRRLALESTGTSKVILEADKKGTRHTSVPASDHGKIFETGKESNTKLINRDLEIKVNSAISTFVATLTSEQEDLEQSSSASGSDAGDRAVKSLPDSVDRRPILQSTVANITTAEAGVSTSAASLASKSSLSQEDFIPPSESESSDWNGDDVDYAMKLSSIPEAGESACEAVAAQLISPKSSSAQDDLDILPSSSAGSSGWSGDAGHPLDLEPNSQIQAHHDASSSNRSVIKNAIGSDLAGLAIIAPPGPLGLHLATPGPSAPPGPVYVLHVKEDSPLFGRLHFGDQIIAIDDKDVREMTAKKMIMLVQSKIANPERKITILPDRRGSLLANSSLATIGERNFGSSFSASTTCSDLISDNEDETMKGSSESDQIPVSSAGATTIEAAGSTSATFAAEFQACAAFATETSSAQKDIDSLPLPSSGSSDWSSDDEDKSLEILLGGVDRTSVLKSNGAGNVILEARGSTSATVPAALFVPDATCAHEVLRDSSSWSSADSSNWSSAS